MKNTYRKNTLLTMAMILATSWMISAQDLIAPSDMVIHCDLGTDWQALTNTSSPVYGRIVAPGEQRNNITTTDRVSARFCEEVDLQDISYDPSSGVGKLACAYYSTNFDQNEPNKAYTMDWGPEGWHNDMDSIKIELNLDTACHIIQIERVFIGYKDAKIEVKSQFIYIHTLDIPRPIVNEKDISDTTDCMIFNLLDTVYLDCKIDPSKIPFPAPFTYPTFRPDCETCTQDKRMVIEYRDIIVGRTAFGYNMARIYLLLDWCTGDDFQVRDSFFIPCFDTNLKGRVYYDTLKNCTPDSADILLTNWKVEATSTTQSFMTFTDSAGDYRFELPPNGYVVQVVKPNDLWDHCPGQENVLVNIKKNEPAICADFGFVADSLCGRPEVQIITRRFRRCRESFIDIIYSNSGTEVIKDAELMIQLDSILELVKSTTPYQNLGNDNYLFEVGDINPGEVRTEKLEVKVACNNVRGGRSVCVKAELQPIDKCEASSLRGLITTSAECKDDSVFLIIKNEGEDMIQERRYWIVEEDLIMFMKRFQLDSGKTITEKYLAEGKTFHIVAENNPNHRVPKSIAGIEGCTGLDSTFSVGFLTQFKLSQPKGNVATDCGVVTGPYDPNDKKSLPAGLGDKKEIFDDQSIDYMVRFQNTGSDTAFNVVITDSLDRNLDWSTIEFISSSHPAHLRVDNGVLICSFTNIMLPDSNVNFDASQGYVLYSAKPQENLRPGTTILNNADIFFDFEAPVRTNTVRLQTFEELSTHVEENGPQDWAIQVLPVPAQDQLLIRNAFETVEYNIFTLEGKRVETGTAHKGDNYLNVSPLPPGIYTIFFVKDHSADVRKIVIE